MKMFYTLFLLGLGLFTGCSESPTDHQVEKPVLTVDDISCTEGWLNLSIPPGMLPAQVLLLQDNQTVMSISVVSADTLLYIPSLTHSKVYVFQASITPPNNSAIFSNVTNLTTLSPTGNSFSWTKHYLGSTNINYSYVNDIAIISENDIWAVGLFVLPDTNLAGYSNYNAAHWDGTGWEYKKLWFEAPGNYQSVPAITGILAFSHDNLFMMSEWGTTFYDGKNQSKTENGPYWTTTIWGSDSNNIYAGGYSGKIYHYNGTVWTLIETGTNLYVNNIYGDYNKRTKSYEIVAVCAEYSLGFTSKIFKIEGEKATEISMQGISDWVLRGWLYPGKKIFVVGDGLYVKNMKDSEWSKDQDPSLITIYCIKGTRLNDIFAGSTYDRLFHFNGIEWKKLFPENPNSSYGKIKIKNDIVVAAGSDGNQGLVTILKR
ncbi:MAG: hypothetical protein KA747_06460 [Ignavibacteriaceae bacterium]|jgi:hypothetical protein|nr:hypothetical protein [Ignavibacteriaceae bacterium]